VIARPAEEKIVPKERRDGEVKKVIMGFQDYDNARDRFMMEECPKGMGAVSTPMSTFDVQQMYSPYYLSYQGVTPFMSPSSSMSGTFFMATPMSANMNGPSFSAFDNAFNQNLFLCPGFGSAPAPTQGYPQ
jgi:hypothetical protein